MPGDSAAHDPDSDGSQTEDREQINLYLGISCLLDSKSDASGSEDTWRPGFHPYLSRCFKHHDMTSQQLLWLTEQHIGEPNHRESICLESIGSKRL